MSATRSLRLLILSFYYPPDLSAGSFRTAAFARCLAECLPEGSSVQVLTTAPNRYATHGAAAPATEAHGMIHVERIALPAHRGGMLDQAKAFAFFALEARKRLAGRAFDLVFATSSRLMTAFLGSLAARRLKAPLYLDIRDIFVDTMGDVLPGLRGRALAPLLRFLERATMRRADRINLVSEGFRSYFQARYPGKDYDFFTNGIDDEFLSDDWLDAETRESGRIRVLYAGNIGEGQGLDRILPALASRAASRYEFKVVGDGGRRARLAEALERAGAVNVAIQPPVPRAELIRLYREADVLFLHLNDYEAFAKVLPSKIFEYSATGKPVLAGVAGYSAQFLRERVENSAVFAPCDAAAGMSALESLRTGWTDRRAFIDAYRRDAIMRRMASAVVRLASN